MDGSQKLPQRLLGTIRDRLAAGASVTRPALSVAAWMRYVTGLDEQGRAIDVSDPLRENCGAAPTRPGSTRNVSQRASSAQTIFGTDLPQQWLSLRLSKRARQSDPPRCPRDVAAGTFSSGSTGEIA